MVETAIEVEASQTDKSEMEKEIGWFLVDYARNINDENEESDLSLKILTEGRNLIERGRERQKDSPGVLDNYES